MEAPAAHAQSAREVARALESDVDAGLTPDAAATRLARYGANRPQRPRHPRYVRLLLNELADPLVVLLVAATAVSIAIGDVIEGTAIAGVLVLNGVLGFWQDFTAERAILALSETFTQHAVVVRGGAVAEIAAEDVVPGDVLLVAEGERVAADGRIVDEHALEVDESALTGESLPVAKRDRGLPLETPLAERMSMVYAGSAVTRGRGRVLVCATGAATQLGDIERLTAAARPPATPLERRCRAWRGRWSSSASPSPPSWPARCSSAASRCTRRSSLGVAVAVAAVPEGLAATVTAALALGGRAMARRGAIVRRLEAIETLGETTVICSDKTGTLTQNRIHVAALKPAAGFDERELLAAAVLASSARETADGFSGDPIEKALLLAAMERALALEPARRARAAARDSLRLRPQADDLRLRRRRPPTRLLPRERRRWWPRLTRDREHARDGRHVGGRGLAGPGGLRADAPESPLDENLEDGLEVVGIVALHDPLRPTAAASVAAARTAGIAVRMLTGDHPATARTIGHALGLADDAVIARATPAEKLALVTELQQQGEVVAVTGDGVNDAPALRKADVGVAMGRGGTEAAREAAAVVLTDDDFATIIAAVAEGRRIGDNIRKFVAFLLSANFGEVIVFAVAIGAGLDPPLAVIQVLLVNLLTDGLPALALARDPASALTMSDTAAPRRPPFDRRLWLALGLIGGLVGAAATAAYLAGLAPSAAARRRRWRSRRSPCPSC